MASGRFGALGVGLWRPGGRGGGGQSPYSFSNAEAVTLVEAMSPQPNDARKAVIDTLVGALKAAGTWTKRDVLYVFAAHNSQAALLNWKAPASFAATEVSAPTFTADRGYNGDGAASRLSLNWNPSTDGVQTTQNSAHMMAISLTAAQDPGVIGGVTSLRFVCRNATDQFSYRANRGTSTALANANGSGHFVATSIDATNTKAYRNGASLGTSGGASVAVTSAIATALSLGAANFTTLQCPAIGFGAALSDAEVVADYEAFQAYLTSLGASI